MATGGTKGLVIRRGMAQALETPRKALGSERSTFSPGSRRSTRTPFQIAVPARPGGWIGSGNMGLTSVYRKRADDDRRLAADPILAIGDRQTLINPGRFDKRRTVVLAEPAVRQRRNFIHKGLIDRMQAMPGQEKARQNGRAFQI